MKNRKVTITISVILLILIALIIYFIGVKAAPSFIATVIKVNGNSMVVEPKEGEEIRKAAGKIICSTNGVEVKVGDTVKITYTGEVAQSYPAQINVIDVKIKK